MIVLITVIAILNGERAKTVPVCYVLPRDTHHNFPVIWLVSSSVKWQTQGICLPSTL